MKRMNPNWLLMMSSGKDKRGDYDRHERDYDRDRRQRDYDRYDRREDRYPEYDPAISLTMMSTTATASATTTASTT